MKLICSDEERKMLSMNHTDITTNGEKIVNIPVIEWVKNYDKDQ
jgi:hypothetical protein